MSILLDAGPALTFLAVGQENILIQLAQIGRMQLRAPERVDREVRGKSRDPRFARTGVHRRWETLKAAGRLRILLDDLDGGAFEEAVGRIAGMPAQDRVRRKASLGEIMVIAHGSVLAQEGEDVVVHIDESDGRRRAMREIGWLRRKGVPGSMRVWTTPQIILQAKERDGWITGSQSWQEVYRCMCAFDDGLPPLSEILPRD